jgi:hypothetical protein
MFPTIHIYIYTYLSTGRVAIADELALRIEEHVAEQQEQNLMCLHDDAMRFKGSTDVSTAASDATDMQSRLIVDDLMLATDGSEGASRADGSEGADGGKGCKRQRMQAAEDASGRGMQAAHDASGRGMQAADDASGRIYRPGLNVGSQILGPKCGGPNYGSKYGPNSRPKSGPEILIS